MLPKSFSLAWCWRGVCEKAQWRALRIGCSVAHWLNILVALLLASQAPAATRNWQNAGTDFNTGSNWSSGSVPGATDIAAFPNAEITNPNLSASVTILGVNFSSMASSGYDLTSSSASINLTLTNTGTGSAGAINALNTTGTNTIDAPIVLGAASGSTQTFTQATGGTLTLNGAISSTNAIAGLTFAGGGTFNINGANSYTGVTKFATGDSIVIGNKSAFGTSTVQANLGTISASTDLSGANAISNAFTGTNNGGSTVFGGSNNIELSGTFTESATRSITNNISGGTLTFSGTVNFSDSSSNFTTTFNGTGNTVVSGNIANGGASTASKLTKDDTGTLTFSGGNSNTYSGKTTVSAGTLILNKTAGMNAISSTGATGTSAANTDLQITGGTVKISANNQIIDTAKIGLSGGTLLLSGTQEGTTATAGVGSLTLSTTSVIDLTGTSLLHFAASGGQSWSGTLSIWNWSGTPVTGGGLEQLLFGTDTTTASLTQPQLNEISFYSGSGTGFLGTGAWATSNNGEVVPVPEPSTWMAAALAVGAIGFSLRRRVRTLSVA